jgi:hypothetical protein
MPFQDNTENYNRKISKMATEEAKKENMLRMTELSLEVLASEVWDTLGESAMVLSKGMGDAILEALEKEGGLELDASDSLAVGKEIDRLFVDELGFAKDIAFNRDENLVSTIKVSNCINTIFTDKLLATGMKMNFTCPIMLTCDAALRGMNIKRRIKIERWEAGKGCIITFSPL